MFLYQELYQWDGEHVSKQMADACWVVVKQACSENLWDLHTSAVQNTIRATVELHSLINLNEKKWNNDNKTNKQKKSDWDLNVIFSYDAEQTLEIQRQQQS